MLRPLRITFSKKFKKVYRPVQGIEIADKHIEVIIRQMFRKVSIIDGAIPIFCQDVELA